MVFTEPHGPQPPDESWPTDCDGDGCGECEVCEYLAWLEMAQNTGMPAGSTIQRDPRMDAYLKWRGI